MIIENNFHDIYLQGIKAHLDHFDYENKPRDCVQKEKIFYNFSLTNPVERVCYLEKRKANLVFQYAEFLWYLSGNQSLDFISYYAPGIKRFSQDGKTLTGTAYGYKLRGSYFHPPIDQIETIISMLKEEPDTKRAVLSIFHPEELRDYRHNIDVSCTLTLQYMIRDNQLISVTNMRANDMFLGVVSDVFSFTMLQEYIAARLGLHPGNYYHVVASSHLYEPNWEAAEEIKNNHRLFSHYPFQFPAMSSENLEADIAVVLDYEEKLRTHQLRLSQADISHLNISHYWKQVLMLFALYGKHKDGEVLEPENLNFLSPAFRHFMEIKFSTPSKRSRQ